VQTLDLHHLGISLISPDVLVVGQRLRVVVEHHRGGLRRLWQWRGRVARVAAKAEGLRVDVEFVSPALGPGETVGIAQNDGREVRFRLDAPWSPPPDAMHDEPPDTLPAPVKGTDVDDPVRSASELRCPAVRVAQFVGLLGFCADQLTKAQAFAKVPTGRGHAFLVEGLRVKNAGVLGGLGGQVPLASAGVALLTLGLVGIVARWSVRDQACCRPLPALGWALILAGMLGNLTDRLLLGYVRDFLQSALWPAWIFNLADVMAIAGVLMILVFWLHQQVVRFWTIR
jgi:signal peptidase II